MEKPKEHFNKGITILHGCGERGIRCLHILRDTGVEPAFFCDRNADNYKEIEQLRVVKIDDDVLFDAAQGHQISVIACVNHPNEILNEWKKFINRHDDVEIHFYSSWAIDMAFYLHKDSCLKNHSAVRSMFIQENNVRYIELTKLALSFFRSIVTATKQTVWVLQAGKVGSSSIIQMLEAVSIPCIHLHGITFPDNVLRNEYKAIWENAIDVHRKYGIKIVSVVREPISRDYSAFWEPFSERVNERIRVTSIIKPNIQKMYDEYLSLILSGNKACIERLGMSKPWVWGDEFEWFDQEIKETLGIDIYEYPFDKEKGYEVIEKDGISIFLFKLEKMDSSLSALGEFVGAELDNTQAYTAESKWLALAYSEFKKKVRIPISYVDHYYRNNRKMDHFYSEEEKEEFIKAWKDRIVDG